MRFVCRQKNLRGIVHAEWREVHKVKMLIRQPEMNLADAIETVEHRLAHRVERVLQRGAGGLGESLEQDLPDTMPNGAELSFVSLIEPSSVKGGREDAVAVFL